ncbi:hypothetical protein HK405_002179, partial [Cladochytrium tenue]
TPHPDSVSTETTILDALKKLHVGHYLHLPVVNERIPVGLVDVLTLTMAMLDYLLAKESHANDGASNPGDSGPMWNRFWNSTFSSGNVGPADDGSDAHSVNSNGDSRSVSSANAYYVQQQPGMYGQQPSPPFVQAQLQRTRSSGFQQVSPYGSPGMPAPQPPLPGVPFQSAASFTSPPLEDRSVAGSTAHPTSSGAPEAATFSFKLRHEASGKVFRFTASAAALDDLFTQIREKTGLRPATDRGNDSTVAADRI